MWKKYSSVRFFFLNNFSLGENLLLLSTHPKNIYYHLITTPLFLKFSNEHPFFVYSCNYILVTTFIPSIYSFQTLPYSSLCSPSNSCLPSFNCYCDEYHFLMGRTVFIWITGPLCSPANSDRHKVPIFFQEILTFKIEETWETINCMK